MDLSQTLLASLSADNVARQNATLALENAARENLPGYLLLLCQELANDQRDASVRMAAGIAVKNSLVARDTFRRGVLTQQWTEMQAEPKGQIKQLALQALDAKDSRAGSAAAQVVASIAYIELPSNAWPDLITRLLHNVAGDITNANLKKASLESIGYICEEIDPAVLEANANEILTAVIQGMRSSETNLQVRHAAAVALLNSLEFVRNNFENAAHRDVIMQVVCETTQCPDESVSVAAFECIVKIVQLYYHKMEAYMNHGIAQMAIMSMRSEVTGIALQAIEFWSTICEIETELLIEAENDSRDENACLSFAKSNLAEILPTLLWCMSKKEGEDDDMEDWNPSMASSTCLSLLATCVRNDILVDGIIFKFIECNVMHSDWRNREAAVMALGAILEGPDASIMKAFVQTAIGILVDKMADPSIAVRDTTAWAIGRLCELFHELIPLDQIPRIINALQAGLAQPPRVATNCAWSLMNLLMQFGSEADDLDTCLVSAEIPRVIMSLLTAAARPDADENNLRTAAYQSLSMLILYAPQDVMATILQLVEHVAAKLEETLTLATQIVNSDDRMRLADLQSNLCTVMQNCIKKAHKRVNPLADRIMAVFIQILQGGAAGKCTSASIEDVFLAVGSLIGEVENGFVVYLEPFMPFVYAGLQNIEEHQLCAVAVGIVGDIARAINGMILPYCDQLVTLLLWCLQNPAAHRSIKPQAFSVLGDIAMAIGAQFSKYLSSCLPFFEEAGKQHPASLDNVDDVDFIIELRESLLEVYTCIAQGFKEDKQTDLLGRVFVEQVTNFLFIIYSDEDRTDTMMRHVIGLIGDLAESMPKEMAPYVRLNWLNELLRSPLGDQEVSESTMTMQKWAINIVRRSIASSN